MRSLITFRIVLMNVSCSNLRYGNFLKKLWVLWDSPVILDGQFASTLRTIVLLPPRRCAVL
jgi:hypothetical protein